jgi:hypothetical protein
VFKAYNLCDLIEIWGTDWRDFEKLGEQIGLTKEVNLIARGLIFNSVSLQTKNAFIEIFDHMCSGISGEFPVIELLYLAALPKGMQYSRLGCSKYLPRAIDDGGSDKDDGKLKSILKKILESFVSSDSIGKAFSKISTKKNSELFIKENSQWTENDFEPIFMVEINERFKELMRWLIKGLENKESCKEAWWNCVWILMQSHIKELKHIEAQIQKDIPLTEGQLKTIEGYMINSFSRGKMIAEDDGRISYHIFLEPEISCLHMAPIHAAVHAFLVQPAFELAKELERNYVKPRFIKKCRSPHCGNIFHTGRSDATACPGSQGNTKNECALAWNRYTKFLYKTKKVPHEYTEQKPGKMPKEVWDNPSFKEEFISYDKS